MSIFIFVLTVYGITNIAVFGAIFDSLRLYFLKISPNFLGKMITCPMCASTWVGFILSSVFIFWGLPQLSPFTSIGLDVKWLCIFLDGCFASGTTWFIHTIQEYFERSNQAYEEE